MAAEAIVVHDGGTVGAHHGRTTGEGSQGRYGSTRRRSSRPTFVVVMQTADMWNCDDRSTRRRLVSPVDGSILIQREMSAPLVIISEVALEVAA